MLIVLADDTFAQKIRTLITHHMGETLAGSRADLSDQRASAQTLLAARFGATSISRLLPQAIATARELRDEI